MPNGLVAGEHTVLLVDEVDSCMHVGERCVPLEWQAVEMYGHF